MRKTLFILILLIIGWTVHTNGQTSNWVFDQEQVLSEKEENSLNTIIDRFEKETTNEVIIVTTPDIGDHEKMVFYAVEFGEKYGVGKKDKNNGLVIVFSARLRETFIATGRGTENILTDPICKRIVDNKMIPHFKEGDYYGGLKSGLLECIHIWGKEK